MADYPEIMAQALASRKSFQGSGGVRVGKSKRDRGIPSRAEALANTRGKGVGGAVAIKAEGKSDLTKLNERIQKRTENESKNAMAKADVRGKKLDNMKKALTNIASFLPNTSQEDYADLHSWAIKETGLSPNILKSPDKISAMNAVEYKTYMSKRSAALSGANYKTVKDLEAERQAQKKADAKLLAEQTKADAKENYEKISLAQEFIKTSLNKYGSPDEMPPKIRANYEQSMGMVGNKLGTEPLPPETPPDPNETAPQAVQVAAMGADMGANQGALTPQAEIDPAILEQYKTMYPDKSDEEIINAYKNSQQ